MTQGIYELVKLGFLGFATAVLVFSYLLLQKITNATGQPQKELSIKLQHIRLFMFVSLAVIIFGLVWDRMDPEVRLRFSVMPENKSGLVIKVDGYELNELLSKIKTGHVPVKNRFNISIDAYELFRQIDDLRSVAQGANNRINKTKQESAIGEIKADIKSGEAGI